MILPSLCHVLTNTPGLIPSPRRFARFGGAGERYLTLRFSSGVIVKAADRNSANSTDLLPGQFYRILLLSEINEAYRPHYAPHSRPTPTEPGIRQGVIIDANWLPERTRYITYHQDFEEIEPWVLVQSERGYELLNPLDIPIDLAIGGTLEWKERYALWQAAETTGYPLPPLTTPDQSFAWQRDPLISPERQQELTDRRLTPVDVATGAYPFRGERLSRADMEWLLATHRSGGRSGDQAGPVDWTDEAWRDRPGLDLRGADLRGVDLSGLPLAGLIGSLAHLDYLQATEEQREWARVQMAGVNLDGAQMQGTLLHDVVLDEASVTRTVFDSALMRMVSGQRMRGEGASFVRTLASGLDIREAVLPGADFTGADLWLTDCRGAVLREANMADARIEGMRASDADLSGADFTQLEYGGANFSHARLTGTRFRPDQTPPDIQAFDFDWYQWNRTS